MELFQQNQAARVLNENFKTRFLHSHSNDTVSGNQLRVSPADIGIISPDAYRKDFGTCHGVLFSLTFDVFLGSP